MYSTNLLNKCVVLTLLWALTCSLIFTAHLQQGTQEKHDIHGDIKSEFHWEKV